MINVGWKRIIRAAIFFFTVEKMHLSEKASLDFILLVALDTPFGINVGGSFEPPFPKTYLHDYAAYCQSKRLGFAMMRARSRC